jgi:hypothetical protein
MLEVTNTFSIENSSLQFLGYPVEDPQLGGIDTTREEGKKPVEKAKWRAEFALDTLKHAADLLLEFGFIQILES